MMNLNTLFPKQAELDKYIMKNKNLKGQDLLKMKTVALICELYECVNEARFFKYWSENKRANIRYCHACNGHGLFDTGLVVEGMAYRESCGYCQGTGIEHNPLLEEFVDTIHFVLSIANDLGVHEHKYVKTQTRDLNDLVLGITNLATIIPTSRNKEHVSSLLNNIISLGYQLGFTEKDVINAYDKKNEINYERQNSNY